MKVYKTDWFVIPLLVLCILAGCWKGWQLEKKAAAKAALERTK